MDIFPWFLKRTLNFRGVCLGKLRVIYCSPKAGHWRRTSSLGHIILACELNAFLEDTSGHSEDKVNTWGLSHRAKKGKTIYFEVSFPPNS